MVERVCRNCRAIVESGSECPVCGNKELSEGYKGKVVVVNPEQSEVAKNMKITKKGAYAVKLG